MSNRTIRAILSWFAAPLLALLMPMVCFAKIVVVDSTGKIVTFDKAPMRVVSLLPSLTENVCDLGKCKNLVGVDSYSNYPDSVNKLPKVGSGLTPNIEAIVALSPDVVVMGHNEMAIKRFHDFHIPVLVLTADTLSQMKYVIFQLGKLLQINNAETDWENFEHALQKTAQSIPAESRGLRVYFPLGEGMYAAGSASFIGEILHILGEKNIVPENLGAFAQITPEYVLTKNPQLIMSSRSGIEAVRQQKAWHAVSAVKRQNLCAFDASQVDQLLRPSFRLVPGAKAMADCVNRFSFD